MSESPKEAERDRDTSAFARWLDSVIPAVYRSDAALAKAVGVDRSMVGRWRRGATPQATSLIRLADATGTSLETLFRISGYRPNAPGKDSEP